MPTDAHPHHPDLPDWGPPSAHPVYRVYPAYPQSSRAMRPGGARAAGVLLALVLGGCALPDVAGQGPRIEDGTRLRTAAAQPPGPPEPRYLRFKEEETQLTSAVDDGRFTYLEFASPLSADVEFFDQDGRPLPAGTAGRVAAIQGLHTGILVRRLERASFVSRNPRTLAQPSLPLSGGTDHNEARAKLENQGGQMQAMQRALEAVKLVPAARPLEPVQTSRSQQLVQLVRSLKGDAPMPSVLPGRSEAPVPVIVPLAAANATSSVPERGLIRVFFASASRAIVAPDDGLGLLLREAAKADHIRVTGYTDAIGSRAANQALAMARADAVVQILLRRGVPPERIVSTAVGAEEYIADNASDRGRALNRRAEVLLLRNGVPLAFAPEAIR